VTAYNKGASKLFTPFINVDKPAESNFERGLKSLAAAVAARKAESARAC
jgi:hypothetical protein